VSTGPDPVKVGVLLDAMDGPDSSPMSAAVSAIRLRFDEALERGELDRPVELVVRLANGLPAGSAVNIVEAYEALVGAAVLGIIGPGVTDNCLVTQPLAEAHGIPTLNFPGTEHSRGVYGFHFQLGSLPDEGPLLLDELLHLGHDRIALIRDQGPIGAEYFDYFDQACQRYGVSLIADRRVSPVATDLSAAVTDVKASGAAALVYLGLGLVIPALARALAGASWAPPRFMNTAFMHGYANPAALAGLEGWVGVDMIDEENDVWRDFLDRYQARHETRPEDPLHACFYDMATMTVEGLRWAPVLTADGLRAGLERVHQLPSVCGGAGTVMGFGPWDRAAYKGPRWLVLREVRDGRYRPYRPR
jgi:branched-chain amino acid transport system substrate-binding protein